MTNPRRLSPLGLTPIPKPEERGCSWTHLSTVKNTGAEVAKIHYWSFNNTEHVNKLSPNLEALIVDAIKPAYPMTEISVLMGCILTFFVIAPAGFVGWIKYRNRRAAKALGLRGDA